MPTTIETMTLRQLIASRAAWRIRLANRRRKLQSVAATRTSLRPRTKVTPQQKRKLLKKWQGSVHDALRILAKLNAEIHDRRTTTLGERAWRAAGELLHVRERGGNNRGAEVERIIRANGGVPGEPWCGDFVAYCYLKAGCKTVTRPWAAVRFLGRLVGQVTLRSKRRGRLGDIVTFTFDHTGLLGWYSDANGREVPANRATHIVAREGNTGVSGAVSDSAAGGDGVHEKVRPLALVARVVRVTR